MLIDELFREIDENKDLMVKIRRHLHMYPEVSFGEVNTAKYISDFYASLDCEVKTNVGGNGVLVVIDTGNAGPSIGLRADFDALPIQEETDLEYSSRVSGVMHACGHDAHTAYLMVLAKILIKHKKELKGKIYIIHQHAEEMTPGGAIGMIKTGLLDNIDNFFGIHVMSEFELGKVYYHKGETQQGRSKFTIKLIGKGGHGSSPHSANDAIVAGSHLVMALQTIVSRRLSPFENGVVTIGSFDGKGTFNIIKESVTITGDVRAMSDKTMKKIEEQIYSIANGVAQTYQMKVDVDFKLDYPILYNDSDMTDLVVSAVKSSGLPVEDCGALPPSEDFSHYARLKPSCFFYVGANKKGTKSYPHHNSHFVIDEGCLEICAKALASVVVKYVS